MKQYPHKNRAQKVSDTIHTLENLCRAHPEDIEELGEALGIIRHYQKHGFTRKDRVTTLPDTTEAFGYFVVYDCTEDDVPIKPVTDDQGNPLTFLPFSKIVE